MACYDAMEILDHGIDRTRVGRSTRTTNAVKDDLAVG